MPGHVGSQHPCRAALYFSSAALGSCALWDTVITIHSPRSCPALSNTNELLGERGVVGVIRQEWGTFGPQDFRLQLPQLFNTVQVGCSFQEQESKTSTGQDVSQTSTRRRSCMFYMALPKIQTIIYIVLHEHSMAGKYSIVIYCRWGG